MIWVEPSMWLRRDPKEPFCLKRNPPARAIIPENVRGSARHQKGDRPMANGNIAVPERLEALLLEGLESGIPIEVTAEYLQKKRTELVACIESKRQSSE